MAVLPIYNCFHPVLRKKTSEVSEFNDKLVKFTEDLQATLFAVSNGVGLAANQVGESLSVIAIDKSFREKGKAPKPIIMINPVIEYFSEEEEVDQEGCLSIPLFYEDVPRAERIKVRYNDINMKEYTLEASEFLARVIQHEVDHLNGILMFERITPLKRALAKSKLKKIERGQVLADYPMILPDGRLLEPEPVNE